MRCTSVVIADRHPVLLQGLNRVLGAEPDFNIVASCGAGADCIDAIRRFGPDIAIVDVAMPGLAGLKILSLVNSNRLSTQVVFFAATVEDCELVTSAAVNGYSIILKDVVPKALVQSLRRNAGGQRLLPLPSSDHAGSREQSAIAENALTMLTDRERQIMRLVSEGLSNKEIGRRLILPTAPSRCIFTTSFKSSKSVTGRYARPSPFFRMMKLVVVEHLVESVADFLPEARYQRKRQGDRTWRG